jgi:nucleotide-binding universal stress UspA family protein
LEAAVKLKDILAIVTSPASDEHVIGLAEQLAQRNSAYLASLLVNWLPSLPLAIEGYTVDPMWGEMVAEAEKRLAEDVAQLKTRLERSGVAATPDSLLLEIGAARSVIGTRARHADLIVLSRPAKANSDGAHVLLEGVLFGSGRPVILVPPQWRQREIGRSVLVCWKPTREAARALADADDFVANANRVTVLTVDARPSEGGYGDQPGADVSTHLARRGAKVELVNADSLGRSETKAIQDQALAIDADLIVMGGYGRSRMSEFVFGGVTRDMVNTSPVPVLMSH